MAEAIFRRTNHLIGGAFSGKHWDTFTPH